MTRERRECRARSRRRGRVRRARESRPGRRGPGSGGAGATDGSAHASMRECRSRRERLWARDARLERVEPLGLLHGARSQDLLRLLKQPLLAADPRAAPELAHHQLARLEPETLRHRRERGLDTPPDAVPRGRVWPAEGRERVRERFASDATRVSFSSLAWSRPGRTAWITLEDGLQNFGAFSASAATTLCPVTSLGRFALATRAMDGREQRTTRDASAMMTMTHASVRAV